MRRDRIDGRRGRMGPVGAGEPDGALRAVGGPVVGGDMPRMACSGDGLRLGRGAAGAGVLLRSGFGAGSGLRNRPGSPGVAEGRLRRDRRDDGLRAVEDRRALRAGVVRIIPALRAGRRDGGMRNIGMPGGGDRLRIGGSAIGACTGLGSGGCAGSSLRDGPGSPGMGRIGIGGIGVSAAGALLVGIVLASAPMTSVGDPVMRGVTGTGGIRIAAGASVGVDPSSAGVVLAPGLGIGMGMRVGYGSGAAASSTCIPYSKGTGSIT